MPIWCGLCRHGGAGMRLVVRLRDMARIVRPQGMGAIRPWTPGLAALYRSRKSRSSLHRSRQPHSVRSSRSSVHNRPDSSRRMLRRR